MSNRDIVTRTGKGSALTTTDYDQNVKSADGTVEQQTGTTYTVVYTDQNKTIELNNGTMVCTLTAIATINGQIDTDNFTVKLTNTNSSAATVNRSSTDTFSDGSTSLTLYTGQSVILQTDTTAGIWRILSPSPVLMNHIGMGSSIYDWTSGSFNGSMDIGTNSAIGDNSDTYIANNLYYDSAWKYKSNGYGLAIQLEKSTGSFKIRTAPNNVSGAGAAATLTNIATIDTSGNPTIGPTANTGYTRVGPGIYRKNDTSSTTSLTYNSLTAISAPTGATAVILWIQNIAASGNAAAYRYSVTTGYSDAGSTTTLLNSANAYEFSALTAGTTIGNGAAEYILPVVSGNVYVKFSSRDASNQAASSYVIAGYIVGN